MNTYLTIHEQKDKMEIITNIEANENINKDKLNATIKQISKLIKKNKRKKKEVVINTDLDLEKDERKDNQMLTLISALNACKIKDKKQRIEYIYMSACKYLDNEFMNKNICEFKDDVCLGKRKYNIKNGCCHEFKMKNILYPKDLSLCRYQKDKHCTADCLGCKVFVCDEVRKKGYKYTYYNVPLIRYFFNIKQKIIIRCSVFTHKDRILKKLYFLDF